MLNFDVMDFGTSVIAALGSTKVRRVASEKDIAAQPPNLSERRAIQSRTRQVANGWSKNERFKRLCAGIACRAWLLDIVDQT